MKLLGIISLVKLKRYNFMAIIFIVGIGCNPDEFQEKTIENICSKCPYTIRYNEEIGVIREILIGANQPGGSYNFFYHDQYTEERPYKLYGITTKDNDFLVPCEPLSEDFKSDGLTINFSGSKSECCNVLTHTNWRAGFGCMIEITSISTMTYN